MAARHCGLIFAARQRFTSSQASGSVVSPHLPCEISEAKFRRVQWRSPRVSWVFNHLFPLIFQSISISFSQLQSTSISFSQFHTISISQERTNRLTTGRWGKQHDNVMNSFLSSDQRGGKTGSGGRGNPTGRCSLRPRNTTNPPPPRYRWGRDLEARGEALLGGIPRPRPPHVAGPLCLL